MNKAIIDGKVDGQPETRSTTRDDVCNFRVRTSEVFKGKTYKQWHKIVAWGEWAQVAGMLREGDRVYLTGKIKTRSYEKDGGKRYITEINADFIEPHDVPAGQVDAPTRDLDTTVNDGPAADDDSAPF